MSQEILEIEGATGEAHERAWKQTVEPIFQAKMDELYEAFMEHPTTDIEGLRLLKLQHNALKSLRDQFETVINTGKLARAQLQENTDED